MPVTFGIILHYFRRCFALIKPDEGATMIEELPNGGSFFFEDLNFKNAK